MTIAWILCLLFTSLSIYLNLVLLMIAGDQRETIESMRKEALKEMDRNIAEWEFNRTSG